MTTPTSRSADGPWSRIRLPAVRQLAPASTDGPDVSMPDLSSYEVNRLLGDDAYQWYLSDHPRVVAERTRRRTAGQDTQSGTPDN